MSAKNDFITKDEMEGSDWASEKSTVRTEIREDPDAPVDYEQLTRDGCVRLLTGPESDEVSELTSWCTTFAVFALIFIIGFFLVLSILYISLWFIALGVMVALSYFFYREYGPVKEKEVEEIEVVKTEADNAFEDEKD